MEALQVTVCYGSRKEYLSTTTTVTWADLCVLVSTKFAITVKQLYYRDSDNDIIAFSTDYELVMLIQQCKTGWLYLALHPRDLLPPVHDVPEKDSASEKSTMTATTAAQCQKANTKPDADNDSDASIGASFTSRFEQLGKLMDKYKDLIQSDHRIMQVMHHMATEITHQLSNVDLKETSRWLESLCKKDVLVSTPTLQPLAAASAAALEQQEQHRQHLYPDYTNQHHRNDNNNNNNNKNDVEPGDTTNYFNDSASKPVVTFNLNDKESMLPSPDSLDSSPPSYDDFYPPCSSFNQALLKEDKQPTTKSSSRHSFPTSSWGEWPAYSLLHPSPSSSPSKSKSKSNRPLPSPPHSATLYNDLPQRSSTTIRSLPTTALDASLYQHTEEPDLTPTSLYPRPPVIPVIPRPFTIPTIHRPHTLPTILKRTSQLLSRWAPQPPALSTSASTPPLPSRSAPAEVSYNYDGRSLYYNDDSNTSSNVSKSTRKQKEKRLDDCHRPSIMERRKERQLYKEQHRALRQQQKELEKAMRDLKQLEKQERKEEERQQRRSRHYQQQASNDIFVAHSSLRRSDSVSSLSSVSSASSCSSISTSSSTQDHSRHHHHHHRHRHDNRQKRHYEQPYNTPSSSACYPSIPPSLARSCTTVTTEKGYQQHSQRHLLDHQRHPHHHMLPHSQNLLPRPSRNTRHTISGSSRNRDSAQNTPNDLSFLTDTFDQLKTTDDIIDTTSSTSRRKRSGLF